MRASRIILWTLAALALFYVASQPHGAALNLQTILDSLERAANSIIVFLRCMANDGAAHAG